MSEPIQRIEKTTIDTFHWHEEIDANFDDYTDFAYRFAWGVQAEVWYLWLWDEEAGQFVEEPEYSTISSPRIDPETQVIDGWNRNSAASDGVTTFHRWEDGKLVCVRRIELFQVDYDHDSPWLLTVKDRVDGELTEVFRMECPWDSDDCFFTRGAWENLDYHGEEAARLEQLLAEQPMDDDHDAFLVDTKGKLGTLLVTVERGNQVYDGNSTTLSVWDPQEMDKPIQEMEKVTYNVLHWHEELDANFDGYTDFSYMYAMGNQPNYWYLWIWDEEAGQFVEEPEYSTISSPRIDPETQVIDGWARNSAASDGVITFHRWEDGKLVCVRRIELFQVDYDHDSPWLLTVKDRVDGELTEVFRMECPWDSDDCFFTRGAWENLDYHGE